MPRSAFVACLATALCAPFACTSSGAGDDATSTGTSEATTSAETSEGEASGTSESGGEEGGGSALPTEAGPDTVVTAFEGTHVFWSGWEEGQNFRQVDAQVEFPEAELGYTQVQMELTLGCPNDLCDWWDRKGYIGIVEDAGTEQERVIEIGRMMTPYRVGGTWTMDVTDLRPLLSGTQTLRVYIDTWVGPGHANGDGWLVDVDFAFTGGLAAEMPVAVLPVYPEMGFDVGDPNVEISSLVEATTVEVPEGASRVELRTLISGHGQGNSENCAEFCAKTHGFIVNSAMVSRTVWRDDCAQNPINNQAGNWQPARAGWCPGDIVDAWREDVTAAVTAGETTVSYALQDYVNTCRPEATTCTGCVLGTGCDYDGGNHTPPHYRLSTSMIVYASE